MPKRVIDFDAMWGSDKLASCAAWAQAEYAWLYGLADASGCFEVTNLRVIWGRVAAIRGDFTIERLEQVFTEFQDKGLMFVWEHEGKRYAHWTGSDVPGRLPAPSWRMRLERFAPPVPKQQLAEYMARFARGRAAMAAGFGGEARRESGARCENRDGKTSGGKETRGGESFHNSQMTEERLPVRGEPENLQAADKNRLKGVVEQAQAQDLDWNKNWKRSLDGNWEGERDAKRESLREPAGGWGDAHGEPEINSTDVCDANAKAKPQLDLNSSSNSNSNSTSKAPGSKNQNAQLKTRAALREAPDVNGRQRAIGDYETESRSPVDSSAEARASANEKLRGDTEVSAADRISGRADRNSTEFSERSRAESERARASAAWAWRDRYRERELATQKELWVGRGPVCGPVGVRPEALERARKREAARAAGKAE